MLVVVTGRVVVAIIATMAVLALVVMVGSRSLAFDANRLMFATCTSTAVASHRV